MEICEIYIFYFIVVTIYATLGDEAIIYGFNEAESTIVMTDAALMPKLKKPWFAVTFYQNFCLFWRYQEVFN